MKRIGLKRLALAVAAVLVLPFLAQTARADNFVDFSCNASTCTGAVTESGGTYSSTGIGGLVQGVVGGPDTAGAFTLDFDTSTDLISLVGNAAANDDSLFGTITSLTATGGANGQLTLNVDWTSLPADFQTYLNTTTGSGIGSVIYLNTGNAFSVDIPVLPTPEPGTALRWAPACWPSARSSVATRSTPPSNLSRTARFGVLNAGRVPRHARHGLMRQRAIAGG